MSSFVTDSSLRRGMSCLDLPGLGHAPALHESGITLSERAVIVNFYVSCVHAHSMSSKLKKQKLDFTFLVTHVKPPP